MKRDLVVDVLEMKGSHYQIGFDQGKKLSMGKDPAMQLVMNPHTDSNKTKNLLAEIAPNFLQELNGLADGLNVDLDTVIKLYSGYDVVFPEMGCTSYANDFYYVRNYDFSPELYDARLVFTNPENGYASIGSSQQILGRLDGMNEKGLVAGLHFVNQQQAEPGFLATSIVRMVLEQCGNIDEAIDLIKRVPHGFCYNYSLMDRDGRRVIVEASPQQQLVRYQTQLMCTNHFEADTLKKNNRLMIEGSLERKQYLQSLRNKNMPPIEAFEHFNNEKSPLFFMNYKEYFGTLHTVVYLPEKLELIAGAGGNCEPYMFSLKNWIEGKTALPKFLKGNIILESIVSNE